MKNLLFAFFVVGLMFNSCTSSKKQIQKGRYDEAIRMSVKKLNKNPDKQKEILNLKKAYNYAVQKDNERVDFLRKTGQPDIWEEVFSTYLKMKNRQELVRYLPSNVLNKIGFNYVDYDNEIISSKQKAAEFLYAYSMKLLEDFDRYKARQAYDQLIRVKNYYPTYRDVDDQIQRALHLGTSYVLFEMKNRTGTPLPPSFEAELYKMSLAEINTKWLKYETRKVDNRTYDYYIVFNIRHIDVSPESIKEIHYTENKEIDDGFQYVLDSSGNVMKDSLGNDIKVPKVKIISCNVVENQLFKAVTVSGAIDFINASSSQILKTEPITSQFFFEHAFAVARGDHNALKPETREKLKSRPVPFPNDFDMILSAGDIVKSMIKDIIRQNRRLIL